MQITYPGMQKLCAANVRFQWNSDLDKELEDLKECLRNNVRITPVDTEKNLILVIDAAPTVGCSYLLLQMKEDDPSHGYNFISMDSSNFRRGQLSLCPFEAECAGLRYACRKENHYLQACPEVLVITDCKSLESTHAKPLETIQNRRIQKMLLDVAHINLTFKHVPGIKNCTTDFRSRQPRDSWKAVTEDDCQVRLRLGIRSVRAQERNLEPVDTRLEVLAENALEDTGYQRMLHHM